MSISQRLIIGFTSLLVLFALAVGTTCIEISAVRQDASLLVELDSPRSAKATEITGQVNESLSMLRAWMVSADPATKSARAMIWTAIAATMVDMDNLMTRDSSPDIITQWQTARAQLAPLHTAEDEVERIANSPDEQPAITILNQQTMPLVNIMGAQLTAMIDEEGHLAATPERKDLLRQMADFRGPLGLAGANLRGYLATGDKAVKTAFDQLFARTRAGHEHLDASRGLLTTTQTAALDKLEAAWVQFMPLPEKLVAIRESDRWNVRNTLMETTVLPRLTLLRDALLGSGHGGVVGLAGKQLADRAQGLNARLDWLRKLSIALLVIGLAVAAVLGTITTRAIVKPLRAMTEAMRRLAAHDFATVIPGIGRKDEIGGMAAAVQAFQRDGIEKQRLEAETADASLKRERQQTEMERYTKEFGLSISAVLETLSGSATTMRDAAAGMSHAVDRTRGQSAATASGAEDSARSLSSVAASTEDMTASVDEIARQAATAAATAREAVDRAETTGRTVHGLSEAASQIGDIVQLITAIAGKTNLLALNATIEAARAGDAGKGFAVVASEVKQLAAQTAEATRQIGAQVAAIQAATGHASDAVRGVAESIMRMDTVASSIAAAVEKQGLATRQIAASVQTVSFQNEGATSAMREVSEVAEGASGSSRIVLAAADDVARVSERLQQEVGQFLKVIRSEDQDRHAA